MGSLASGAYGRFIVTLLFDNFVTAILFKALYTRLIQFAGFTETGREWIANAFVSTFIGVITFLVYCNLTRTRWAYPSGSEVDVLNQWISGHAMALATVAMNMGYIVAETRSRIGEPGFNDPGVKILVTAFTFLVIWQLSSSGELDPSLSAEQKAVRNTAFAVRSATEVDLPLPFVCETRGRFLLGTALFGAISASCLGIVIFGTSNRAFSSLSTMCCGGEANSKANAIAPVAESAPAAQRALRQWYESEPSEPGATTTRADRLKGKCCLFWCYLIVVWCVIVALTFVPLKSAPGSRDMVLVRAACESY